MTNPVSECAFEDAIEAALLRHGPDEVPAVAGAVAEMPPPYGDPDMQPGGYRRRRAEDYDRALCLLPRDVLDFVQATPAEGVAAAVGAPWRFGAGAVPEAPLVRD